MCPSSGSLSPFIIRCTAAVLKARGMDPAEIADITGLSIEDIERL